MEKSKKIKRKVTKKDRKEHLGSRSLQNVSIHQRMYRVSQSAFCEKLTGSMEQSSYWETNTSSASQEISRTLWNTMVITIFKTVHHLTLHWAHINPVHGHPVNSYRVHSDITLKSNSTSSKWFFPVSCPHQNIFLRLSSCQPLRT
jgi:hypothetical protein